MERMKGFRRIAISLWVVVVGMCDLRMLVIQVYLFVVFEVKVVVLYIIFVSVVVVMSIIITIWMTAEETRIVDGDLIVFQTPGIFLFTQLGFVDQPRAN